MADQQGQIVSSYICYLKKVLSGVCVCVWKTLRFRKGSGTFMQPFVRQMIYKIALTFRYVHLNLIDVKRIIS